jgi:hypothetical protein
MELSNISESPTEALHREQDRRTVYLLDVPGIKFTRLRYLGGMTPMGWQWDLSYAHGILPDGEMVDIAMPYDGQIIRTRSSSDRELIYNLVQFGVRNNFHMMKAGLRAALSYLK